MKIKSIKPIGKRRTYDIEVEDNHNFILNNKILSHNSEVKGMVQGSEDYLVMFKTTSFKDKEEMCEILRREKRMRPDQVNDLSFLNKGECFIAESGNRNVQKIKIILPRSAFWKKEYPNFYKSFWEKHGGDWKNINPIIDEINSIYDSNKDKYANEVKEKKNGNGNKVEIINNEVENTKNEIKDEIPIVQIKPAFKPKSLLELYNK